MSQEQKQVGKMTFNDQVLIKLDPENDKIKMKSGFELYIVQEDKDITVTGTVCALPSHLSYTGKPNIGMPWLTNIEVKIGDEVIIYYLSILNALRTEMQKYFIRNDERYVFVPYSSIFAKVEDNKPIPVNGYCLIEPVDDPVNVRIDERLKAIGLVSAVPRRKKTNNQVVWGKVAYTSKPNKEYAGGAGSDRGVDIEIGDIVVMKKISDVLMQYELHQRVDEKQTYYRVQRRYIYAKI